MVQVSCTVCKLLTQSLCRSWQTDTPVTQLVHAYRPDAVAVSGNLLSAHALPFASQTNVILQVTVAGQVLPVLTSIRMQLTSTRISFQPSHVDFGECNLGEKTGISVQVTNHSILPQKYGKSRHCTRDCCWLT